MTMTELIKGMDYETLRSFKKEMEAGEFKALIDERLALFEDPNKVCPVCGTRVDPCEAITLYFGPRGFRQRASFDGEDCLRVFIAKQKYSRY